MSDRPPRPGPDPSPRSIPTRVTPWLRSSTLIFARPGRDCLTVASSMGPVVEHLIRDGFEVVVISARQVKSLRVRYGSAGNKDDRFDAFVLADALRTERRPLGHRAT